jgi:hypothetical protein
LSRAVSEPGGVTDQWRELPARPTAGRGSHHRVAVVPEILPPELVGEGAAQPAVSRRHARRLKTFADVANDPHAKARVSVPLDLAPGGRRVNPRVALGGHDPAV